MLSRNGRNDPCLRGITNLCKNPYIMPYNCRHRLLQERGNWEQATDTNTQHWIQKELRKRHWHHMFRSKNTRLISAVLLGYNLLLPQLVNRLQLCLQVEWAALSHLVFCDTTAGGGLSFCCVWCRFAVCVRSELNPLIWSLKLFGAHRMTTFLIDNSQLIF